MKERREHDRQKERMIKTVSVTYQLYINCKTMVSIYNGE